MAGLDPGCGRIDQGCGGSMVWQGLILGVAGLGSGCGRTASIQGVVGLDPDVGQNRRRASWCLSLGVYQSACSQTTSLTVWPLLPDGRSGTPRAVPRRKRPQTSVCVCVCNHFIQKVTQPIVIVLEGRYHGVLLSQKLGQCEKQMTLVRSDVTF